MSKLVLVGSLVAALAVAGAACSPEIETIPPSTHADGGALESDGGSTACKPVDVKAQACSAHSECGFAGACEAGKAVCDKAAKKCTSDAIFYDKEDDPAPGKLDFSCYGKPADLSNTPATVTVIGCLVPFGVEASTSGIDVAIYATDNLTTPLKTVKTDDPSKISPGLKCKNDKYGAFKLEGMPTAKRLVAKASGDPKTFHTTYRFNVAYDGKDASATGEISGTKAEINIISDITWNTIPPLLGLSSGIAKGNAALAGAIEDCTGKVVANANVVVDPKPSGVRFGYFNSSIDDPKPQLSRKATNVNGLYAAINVPPQKFTVKATVANGGATVDFGTFPGESFADSVTILTITRPLP
jgi:hypothetical protein